MSEDFLTQCLVNQLKGGGIKKLTKLQKHADFTRELGDNSFRADIFINLSNLTSTKKSKSKNAYFIAIEVKIKDWKQGLYQAWKYNSFAEKSYLALYKKYAEKVDIELFQHYNVGLIIFDEDTIEVLNAPKNNKFKGEIYSNELRSKLWTKLHTVKSI